MQAKCIFEGKPRKTRISLVTLVSLLVRINLSIAVEKQKAGHQSSLIWLAVAIRTRLCEQRLICLKRCFVGLPSNNLNCLSSSLIRLSSTYIDLHRLVDIGRCWSILVDIGRYRSISVDIGRYRSISVDIGRYRSIQVDDCCRGGPPHVAGGKTLVDLLFFGIV